jgi:hypothetical protein
VAQLAHNPVENTQLLSVGKGAAQQQVNDFLKPETLVFRNAGDKVADVDAAVDQPAVHRGFRAVLNIVALR